VPLHTIGLAVPTLGLPAVLTLWLPAAGAQPQYPVKPIRAIVPFVAGGSTDIMARALAQKLSGSFGQQVIVDNRGGGGGLIAAVMAKEAPADGYTIFFATISVLSTNVAVYPKLPYDPLRDYAPITMTATNPLFLVTHPTMPGATVKEFVAAVRLKPGLFTYSSSGTGGAAHLAGALFASLAKLDMVHVPYKGAAPSMTDLVAGQVNSTFAQPASVLGFAKAGKIKVLGVSSKTRLASWPDAPPVMDTVPGYESASWQGVVAPARTPLAVIERLHRAVVTALNSNDLRKRLIEEGSEIGGMPPAEFANYIRAEIGKWSRVVREAKIKVE
jgi:tripartite-type tricarboxylate transporter receptor subunit TctC